MKQFRKITVTFALTLFSIVVTAQVSDKLSVDARMMLEKTTSSVAAARSMTDSPLPFIIRIDENRAAETIEALREAGAVLRAQIGSQLSAEIPLSCLSAVEAIEGVVRIGTAGAAPKPMTDVTRKEVGVSALDGTEGTVGDMAYTGKDVTVAVIDIGFDFQHPAFKDSEGRTRIKAYYSPFDNGGTPVVINGMQLPGSVYDTPEQIAKLVSDFKYQSHGTHTSTIAAGTRSAQGWGGMAPDADIVLCAYVDMSSMSTEKKVETMSPFPSVFDALAFLKYYQEKSGKPMAVNMSIGNVAGPHNGRDEMPLAIRDFIAPGRLVAISSGNDGAEPRHLKKVFASDKDTLRTMLQEEDLQLEGYIQQKAPLSAQLTLYEALAEDGNFVYQDHENYNIKWTAKWKSPVISAGADGTYKLNAIDDPKLAEYFPGEIYLKLDFDETLGTTQLKFNHTLTPVYGYSFELSLWSTAGTQIDLFNAKMQAMGRANCTSGNTELSCNNWASAEKAVSVGNYCANTTYRSLFNEKDEDSAKLILGDISRESSYGKALNGRQIPMVAAPGTNILSAVSQFYIIDFQTDKEKSYNKDMTWQNGLYDSLTGTSMSSPAVAGIFALWLQADPTLSPEDLEAILKETCRTDDFTKASPQRFGYGKVDAKRGLELVLERKGTAIRSLHTSTAAESAIYDLQGRKLNKKPTTKGLYINNGRKILVK
jgi:subtilisin family serine protease